jgi:hypothetical protein
MADVTVVQELDENVVRLDGDCEVDDKDFDSHDVEDEVGENIEDSQLYVIVDVMVSQTVPIVVTV